uniref:Uncharacterized protein n=1 Tax=Glossina pallidipes TaxID=7398 RepID=A0A1B0AAI0_GLOPL
MSLAYNVGLWVLHVQKDSCVENSHPVRYAYQYYMNQLLSNGLHQFDRRSLNFSPDICYAHTVKMTSDKHINIFVDLVSPLILIADNDTADMVPVVDDDGHSIDCYQTDAFDDRNIDIDCRIYFADDMIALAIFPFSYGMASIFVLVALDGPYEYLFKTLYQYLPDFGSCSFFTYCGLGCSVVSHTTW